MPPASAELSLQRANRFDDVYLFYDPITFQDNSPFNAASTTSWAVGLTFALPIFNRNQGNIAQAESNISQTKLELSALERRALAEVTQSHRDAVIRHRRAMLELNTAVGLRLLP